MGPPIRGAPNAPFYKVSGAPLEVPSGGVKHFFPREIFGKVQSIPFLARWFFLNSVPFQKIFRDDFQKVLFHSLARYMVKHHLNNEIIIKSSGFVPTAERNIIPSSSRTKRGCKVCSKCHAQRFKNKHPLIRVIDKHGKKMNAPSDQSHHYIHPDVRFWRKPSLARYVVKQCKNPLTCLS